MGQAGIQALAVYLGMQIARGDRVCEASLCTRFYVLRSFTDLCLAFLKFAATVTRAIRALHERGRMRKVKS